jgi:hypothetical protein
VHSPSHHYTDFDSTLYTDKLDIAQTLLYNKPFENFYKVQLQIISKIKFQKFTLQQATKAQRGEERYSSTPSLTPALEWGGWSSHAPAALPPVKSAVNFRDEHRGGRAHTSMHDAGKVQVNLAVTHFVYGHRPNFI